MKKTVRQFAVLYFVSQMFFGMYLGYQVVYLRSTGMPDDVLGFTIALAALLGSVGQFMTGRFIRMTKSVKWLYIGAYIALAITIALILNIGAFPILLILMVGLLGVLSNTIAALLDSWVMASDESVRNRFGFVRSFGSLGWSIAVFATGYLLTWFGWNFISVMFLLSIPLMIYILYGIKDITPPKPSPLRNKVQRAEVGKVIRTSRFFLLIAALVLIYICMQTLNVYSIVRLQDVGGTEIDVGYYVSLQALIEVPGFILMSHFSHRINAKFTLILAALFYTIRIVLIGVAATPLLIILSGLFQLVTFVFLTISTKFLINELVPQRLSITLQTTTSAVFLFTSVITNIVGGIISKAYGTSNLFFFVAIFGVFSIGLSFIYYKKYGRLEPLQR